MRQIQFVYNYNDIFEYCRGVTLLKVYSLDKEENAKLAEMYGVTIDEEDHFVLHCMKYACDAVYLAIKNHCYGTTPYEFNVTDAVGNQIITYNLNVGAVQDDMIKSYILEAIRNYSIMEWYKMKGEPNMSAFHENEYNKNISHLQHYATGNNTDTGNINTSKRRGIFN
jgi:hypothetical protein